MENRKNKIETKEHTCLLKGTSEDQCLYLLEKNKEVTVYTSKSEFITALNDLK